MNLTPEELEKRLKSPNNLVNHLKSNPKGRKPGSPNLTEGERETIAELAITGEHTQKEIADAYGVSPSTVSAAKTGRVGGLPATEDRKAKRQEIIDATKDAALAKLMQTLGLIDENSLTGCTAKELSSVAVNMARVHASLTPINAPTASPVQINIYTPAQASEATYKVVEV